MQNVEDRSSSVYFQSFNGRLSFAGVMVDETVKFEDTETSVIAVQRTKIHDTVMYLICKNLGDTSDLFTYRKSM